MTQEFEIYGKKIVLEEGDSMFLEPTTSAWFEDDKEYVVDGYSVTITKKSGASVTMPIISPQKRLRTKNDNPHNEEHVSMPDYYAGIKEFKTYKPMNKDVERKRALTDIGNTLTYYLTEANRPDISYEKLMVINDRVEKLHEKRSTLMKELYEPKSNEKSLSYEESMCNHIDAMADDLFEKDDIQKEAAVAIAKGMILYEYAKKQEVKYL